MNPALLETSPDAFVRSALPPFRRDVSALVVDTATLDNVADKLRTTLQQIGISFVETELDGRLQRRQEAVRTAHPIAVVLASKSEDAELWRRVDLHRSRLDDGAITYFLLSRNAAISMHRNAPNLMSLLGPLRSYQDSTLEPLIESAANARYPELYEPADQRPARNLEQVTEGILNAFGNPQTDHHAWRRFGHMGRALLIEVLPTIAGHWPAATPKANSVLAALETWLSSSSSPPPVNQDIDGPLAPQALAEALDVVRNASRLTDRAHARRAIADMVDDCLQGYAIVPGSEGRRSVFNWWLHVVVPAAWALQRSARFDAAVPQP